MDAVREFPPNPHALIIHTAAALTDETVETYVAGSSEPSAEWIRRVLSLPGVRVLSLNAYKIRLQKHKDASWQPILEPFETILRDVFGLAPIRECVIGESPSRVFAWYGEPLRRRVFEGKRQASSHQLAAALFAIHGVAQVILDDHRVEVHKCPLCNWSDLAPAIQRCLAP